MQGLIGREWVKFTDVVAILGNFEEDEFLAYAPGPYLLEIPTENDDATTSDTGPIEVSELYKRSEAAARQSPTRRGSRETQRIERPKLGEPSEEAEGEGTRSFSVEDLIKRKRKKTDSRILFLGGHVRTTFGRGSDADVRIVGRAVSRVHAAFLGGSGDVRWNVVDLGSSNGTMVNGRRLTPQLPVSIHDEPVVQLGDWRCAVMFPARLWDVAEKLRVAL